MAVVSQPLTRTFVPSARWITVIGVLAAVMAIGLFVASRRNVPTAGPTTNVRGLLTP